MFRMIEQLFEFEGVASTVGAVYIFIGIIGFVCNIATLLMIASYRIYRLSAYTIMANLALADAIMLIIAGLVCGLNIIQVPFFSQNNSANYSAEFLVNNEPYLSPGISKISGLGNTNTVVRPTLRLFENRVRSKNVYKNQLKSHFDTSSENLHFSIFLLSFFEIAAWTAGMISYAFLGINRCVAICFYRTRAKTINRVSFAIIGSTVTWIIGTVTACIGTVPVPLMGMRMDMWSVSFLSTAGSRPATFMVIASFFNFASILTQWSCSLMALLKIRKVRHKISCNKLNINSANRFKKQARLTFQFFYPSLICTISSIIFFSKPFMTDVLTNWQFIFLHLVWLCNHICNPFIYAYFNERMRLSYGQWFTCVPLRRYVRGCRKQYWQKHGKRLRVSKRLNASASTNRNARRQSQNYRNGDFVRSSLQMQSRDFEQLCEFMMRVNPANDSSEGWIESSSDAEAEPTGTNVFVARTSPGVGPRIGNGREPQSLVYDLGRQTVQHWANFAKKASF